jgi:phosphoserine phosphatase
MALTQNLRSYAMYTVTLLSNPVAPCLTAEHVDTVRNPWGGSDVNWLADGEAAQFRIEGPPETFAPMWGWLQDEGVDLIVARTAQSQPKKLLIADMDSTMIGQECIDELADFAGVGARVADITARAMNGELDFPSALRERVGLLKGLSTNVIDTVFDERITLASGGPVLLATMKRRGAKAALVSGGFTVFTSKVADALGFDFNRANILREADGVLTGEVEDPILGADAKVEALTHYIAEMGIDAADVVAVGDGANDIPMLQTAGLGVAVHAKPIVQKAWPFRVNHGDLTSLLFLQGIAKSEFTLA